MNSALRVGFLSAQGVLLSQQTITSSERTSLFFFLFQIFAFISIVFAVVCRAVLAASYLSKYENKCVCTCTFAVRIVFLQSELFS